MNPIGGPLLIALLVVLGLSVAGNAVLGAKYLDERDTATTAVSDEKHAAGAAMACSQGTEALVTSAAKAASAAAPKRAAAAKVADAHNAKADTILAAPPAVPGDACKSAEAVVDSWWAGRK